VKRISKLQFAHYSMPFSMIRTSDKNKLFLPITTKGVNSVMPITVLLITDVVTVAFCFRTFCAIASYALIKDLT
jgi:hypothetical protein